MPRVVVVNAAHGDPAPQQDIGVDRHIGAGVDQAAEHVTAAGPQHLQTLRDDIRHAAHLDHGVGAVGPAQRPDLVDDGLCRQCGRYR